MILFGSGNLGYQALQFVGEENVLCFCDNNPKVVGTERYGKEVISFEELKRKYYEEVIMICAGDIDSFAMAKQCEENNVFDYLIYIFIVERFSEKDKLFSFLDQSINRMKLRKEIYLRKIRDLDSQVEYFRNHVDIRYIKPATGKLRERQLKTVQISAEFFEKIKDIDIKPILYGGNLLGYVRHHGFIPWDDDIDFALMRKEYDALKEYCKKHIYTIEEFQNKKYIEKTKEEKQIAEGLEEYYWILYFDHFRIIKDDPEVDNLGVDFFSLDYYVDSYSFEELKEVAETLRERLAIADSNDKKIVCMEQTLKENKNYLAEDSNHIYFGMDNMEFIQNYDKCQWFSKDILFPLKKVFYEGEQFFIPNRPEDLAKYEYGDIWKYPEDAGIPRHFRDEGDGR